MSTLNQGATQLIYYSLSTYTQTLKKAQKLASLIARITFNDTRYHHIDFRFNLL